MRILIAAGGSGGHIFPAAAFAEDLKDSGVSEIFFVSSRRRLDKNIIKGLGYRSYFLSVNPMPFNRSIVKWCIFLVKMSLDLFTSIPLMLILRPDVVVGFGGYSSGAIVKCAGIMNIPVVIHEQNLIPGRANLRLGEVSDTIAVSFPGCKAHFPDKCDNKIVFTGNPIRINKLSKDRSRARKILGIDENKSVILVMGGSQGSTFLNTTVSKAVDIISAEKRHDVEFIHLTGSKDFEKVKSFYENNRLPVKTFSFLDKIDMAYAACDMAVSRAGAAALFELAYYEKPMILVPYPNPKNNQRANAEYFSEKGAAFIREEKVLTPEILAEDMTQLLTDREKYGIMLRAAGELAVADAGKRLVKVVLAANKNYNVAQGKAQRA